MKHEDLLCRISVDPEVCGGKPCIREHRIWVSVILDFLAEGATIEELLLDYPQLTAEDVRACIAFGSEMTRERTVHVACGWRPATGAKMKLKLDENIGNRGVVVSLRRDHRDCARGEREPADSDVTTPASWSRGKPNAARGGGKGIPECGNACQ